MKPLYLGCRKINPAAQGKELENASKASTFNMPQGLKKQNSSKLQKILKDNTSN